MDANNLSVLDKNSQNQKYVWKGSCIAKSYNVLKAKEYLHSYYIKLYLFFYFIYSYLYFRIFIFEGSELEKKLADGNQRLK